MRRNRTGIIFLILMVVGVAAGCVHHRPMESVEVNTAYLPQGLEGTLIGLHAPVFVIHEGEKPYNRIGRPEARFEKGEGTRIRVNPDRPVVYVGKQAFSTGQGRYLNLIYRIHFSEVPYSLTPFYLTAGKNVGLLAVITLDETERPVLVTTVHTCGCYVAVVPTSHLAPDALPEGWKKRSLKDPYLEVHGERLPWQLHYGKAEHPRLLIHIKPALHRVMHMEVLEERGIKDSGRFTLTRSRFADIHGLETLPLDGSFTSFYYGGWPLRGHVKGSIKPWESLFMSLVSMDLFVGADKTYVDRNRSGNPFYTSLKPWNRNRSDMGRFARFLQFYGWRL